jgi:CHAT domain-containing protein
MRLDLSTAQLVTLSACETGITDVQRNPEEFLGLPAGFIQAGAAGVVSSLWPVDDRCTSLLMEQFYKNYLQQNMPPSTALRLAQFWLRDLTRTELGEYYGSFLRMTATDAQIAQAEILLGGAPDENLYESPFYWAAFTYNGL